MPRAPGRLDRAIEPPEGFLPDPDTRTIAEMTSFVLARWRERAAEMTLPEPTDLSGSCRFSSLFVQALHGGSIRGYNDHFHVRLPSGLIVDLNTDAADVRAIRERGGDPHWHHRAFMGSREVRESFDTCRPRVERWTSQWLAHRSSKEDVSE